MEMSSDFSFSFLILLLLGGVGMTFIVVESSLFIAIKDWLEKKFSNMFLVKYPVKLFLKIASCHQCCGWWSGLILSLVFSPFRLLTEPFSARVLALSVKDCGVNFAVACAVSFLSFISVLLINFIESQTMVRSSNE